MGPQFPWELLQAGCLRLICQQLSGRVWFSRKEDIIRFLKDVDENGLESALIAAEALSTSTPSKPSKKRKFEVDSMEGADTENEIPSSPSAIDAYNTRFKGSKRVKMTKQVPEEAPAEAKRKRGRPRKSAPASLPTMGKQGGRITSKSVELVTVPKRPRGRPPKHMKARPSRKLPKVSGTVGTKVKQVFDGVVLSRRRKSTRTSKDSTNLLLQHDPDADAEGEIDVESGEEWDHIPHVSQAAESIHQTGIEESSLADSNKENEIVGQSNGH